jgi:hypothetical protein
MGTRVRSLWTGLEAISTREINISLHRARPGIGMRKLYSTTGLPFGRSLDLGGLRGACLSLALTVLIVGHQPATASDRFPTVILPAIGLGDINRVPCDIWESQTPVPFLGSQEELFNLCPGDLTVQLHRLQRRLRAWTEKRPSDAESLRASVSAVV